MPFKDISLFSSGGRFVQHGETVCKILVECIIRNFCEIILNLDKWSKRCLLKIFLF